MTNDTQTIAILSLNNNQGYAANQATNGMTLADLLELVEYAIEDHGEDAKIVTRDTGNRRGANWGSITLHSEIEASDDDKDDCDCDIDCDCDE